MPLSIMVGNIQGGMIYATSFMHYACQSIAADPRIVIDCLIRGYCEMGPYRKHALYCRPTASCPAGSLVCTLILTTGCDFVQLSLHFLSSHFLTSTGCRVSP